MAPRKNYPLRLNPELYAALERWAADEMRSVNAQMEFLLTQAVRRAGRLKDTPQAPEQTPDQSPTDQLPTEQLPTEQSPAQIPEQPPAE